MMAGSVMLKTNAKAEPDTSSAPTAPPVSRAVPVAPDQKGCAPSFLTQQKNEIGQVCSPVQPESKEEYVQPDEEKDAGGEA
jgi:hypothetical protein